MLVSSSQNHSVFMPSENADSHIDEGVLWAPQNISSEADLVSWLRVTFPLSMNDVIAKILLYYPSSNASDSSNEVEYATLGYTGASAINVSSVGVGQQQRANVRSLTDSLSSVSGV